MGLFGLHVSRITAISSASTFAKLSKNVSEALSIAPTKIAAGIILKILDTIQVLYPFLSLYSTLTFPQEVDDNDEAHIKLMKRIIDFLLVLHKHLKPVPET